MIRKVIDYVKDQNFRVNIINNEVNIINYKKIIILEDNKLVVSHNNGSLTISGINIKIKKLLDDELLISGDIKTIELR